MVKARFNEIAKSWFLLYTLIGVDISLKHSKVELEAPYTTQMFLLEKTAYVRVITVIH
jgi:hypothetical protein